MDSIPAVGWIQQWSTYESTWLSMMMNKTCGCFADLIMHTSTFLLLFLFHLLRQFRFRCTSTGPNKGSSEFGSDLLERWRLVLMIWCRTPFLSDFVLPGRWKPELTGSECAAHSGPSFSAPYAPSCLLSCFHGSDCCCHVVSAREPHISQHSRSPELILHEIKNVFFIWTTCWGSYPASSVSLVKLPTHHISVNTKECHEQ